MSLENVSDFEIRKALEMVICSSFGPTSKVMVPDCNAFTKASPLKSAIVDLSTFVC